MSELIIYSDGASRGNPGVAGAGAVLKDLKGKVVAEICRYLSDQMTNNQAEYHALILAVKEAKKKSATSIAVFADSELMVKQLKGEYKVKNEGIKPLYLEAIGLLRNFGSYSIDYIPREKNKRADQLANLAIDGQVL